MIALKRILLPTDFSEYAGVALRYACAFAKQFGAELHLLHVVEYVVPPFPLYGVNTSPPRELAEWRKSAHEQIEKIPGTTWEKDLKVIRAVETGRPHEEIADYVKENAIDLVIMGTHGHSALLHLLMGSVAQKVIHKAPCPVLTVHPDGHHFVQAEQEDRVE